MIHFSRPSEDQISTFLSQQQTLDFTYAYVGATKEELPSGFVVDRSHCCIGQGRQTFEAAKQALVRWQHFQLGWIEPCWPSTPIDAGAVVGILAKWSGLWFINACRIVYVIDQCEAEKSQFGFAYGTLPGHAECGEERFLLVYDEKTQSVDYQILAFSRPNKWFSKVAYPLVRRQQRRFARDSLNAMQTAVQA